MFILWQLLSCSTSKIIMQTSQLEFPVFVVPVTSEALAVEKKGKVVGICRVVVTVDSLGNKTYTSDDFSYTDDSKGGRNFNKESSFYVGVFSVLNLSKELEMINAVYNPVSLADMHDDAVKNLLTHCVNYQLIAKAKTNSANVLLAPMSYEWTIEEISDSKTRLFGLLPDKIMSAKYTYTLTGDSEIAYVSYLHSGTN